MATEREIYVGYLPMRPGDRQFTRFVAVLIVLAGVVAGVLLAHALRPAGTGAWNTSETVTLTGTLRLAPYPHLVTPDGAVLLAEPGKLGTQVRFAGMDAHEIRLTGTLLRRGDWRALEVLSHEPLGANPETTPTLAFASEPLTLRGEILDSKCFFGAMKPGDGLTHKACAILCLRGGIAPLIVGEDETGRKVAAVICSTGGGPIQVSVMALAGEPVLATGRLGTLGPLRVFAVDAAGVLLASERTPRQRPSPSSADGPAGGVAPTEFNYLHTGPTRTVQP